MTTDTYHLIGAYALDAVDDAEREQVDEYLLDHPEHEVEMRSLRDAAAELSVLTEAEPPAGMRAAVLDSISQTRPLPPLAPDSEDTEVEAVEPAPVDELAEARERRTSRWSRGLLSAAAAIAIMTAGAGVAVWAPWQDDTRVTVAQEVTEAPDAKRYTLPLGDHRATVIRSESQGRAVLTSDDLTAPPAGKAYQMWLQQPDGRMTSAGLVPKINEDGSVTMVLKGDAARAVGAGMTLEPAGGSEQPTTDPMGLVEF